MPAYVLVAIKDLRPGDMVDLEGDKYADPDGGNAMLADRLHEVDFVEVETRGCTCVDFLDYSCGFPPDHEVRVHSRSA